MPDDPVIRTERYRVGNRDVQKTTYSSASNEEMGRAIAGSLAIAAILSPFAFPLWLMYVAVTALKAAFIGVLFAVIAAAAIAYWFVKSKYFRIAYTIINAVVIAAVVYNLGDHDAKHETFISIVAAVLFLVAAGGGLAFVIGAHDDIQRFHDDLADEIRRYKEKLKL